MQERGKIIYTPVTRQLQFHYPSAFAPVHSLKLTWALKQTWKPCESKRQKGREGEKNPSEYIKAFWKPDHLQNRKMEGSRVRGHAVGPATIKTMRS